MFPFNVCLIADELLTKTIWISYMVSSTCTIEFFCQCYNNFKRWKYILWSLILGFPAATSMNNGRYPLLVECSEIPKLIQICNIDSVDSAVISEDYPALSIWEVVFCSLWAKYKLFGVNCPMLGAFFTFYIYIYKIKFHLKWLNCCAGWS